ncbi:MAG: response regulator [Rhodothermales bacterium]|nr:response regulator [Rhodothermales bacterium]
MGLDPSRRLTQAVSESWGEEEGLPQSSVRSLLQTPDGYLWAGTQGGLVRFNGRQFDVFDRSNSAAFVASHGTRSLLWAEDSLWVGTSGSGLLRWDGSALVRAGLPEELSRSVISSIAAHPEGTVWAATFGDGVFVYPVGGGPIRRITAAWGLPDDYTTAISIESDGTAWLGTKSGLARIKDGQLTVWDEDDGLPSSEITSVISTSTGLISVGTKAGLRVFDGTRFTTDVAAADEEVDVQFEDRFGSRWLGTTTGGVVRLTWNGIDRYTTEHGLTHDAVAAFVEDAEGSVWIGTDGGGLNRLRPGKFESYTVLEGMASNMAYGVWVDPSNRIWVGSESDGISVIDQQETRLITTQNGLSGDNVMSIAGTSDGAVWAGTYGAGLNRISPEGDITHFSAADGLAHDVVSSIVVAPGDVLWIGTDGGVSRYADGEFYNTTVDDGLPSPYIMSLYRDSAGGIWAGTYDGGVAHIEGSQITVFDTDAGLGVNMVLDAVETAPGEIWLATYGGGLSRVQQAEVTTLTMQDGLFDDTIYGLVVDDLGQLWMTSPRGLFSVPVAELNAVANGVRERVNSTSYGRDDGLKSNEFNGGFQPAAWRGPDGRLVFPSIEGIAVISPHNVPRNTVVPPVHLEHLKVDGSTTTFHAGLVTDVTPGRVEVAFAGLSFMVPEEVQYRYMLEGYDADWTYTYEPKAVYTNLPAKQMLFRVQAANNDGLWNEIGAEIAINRPPRFWETGWFAGLCLLLILATTWLAVKLRLKAMKERQRQLEQTVAERTRDLREEKERVEEAKTVIEAQAEKLKELDRFKTKFFSNVSHEFRTPLTMIVGPLENALKGQYGDLSDALRRQSQIMLRNALRLLNLINQLMDLSKLEAGRMPLKAGAKNIVTFMQNLQLTVTALAEKKNIEMPFEAPGRDIELYFEPDKMEKVFYNLLSNALKFTPEGGRVGISIAETDDTVTVTVKDSGKGIPREQLPHVFDRFHQVEGTKSNDIEGTGIGLSLVKEMVLLHGGEVSVDSEVGEWTAFSVTLRKGTEHLQQDQIVAEITSRENNLSTVAKLAEGENLVEVEDRHWKTVNLDAPLIMVADDNPDVRSYVSEILETHGYRTVKAFDGQDGLEKARIRRPRLILSDVMMPRMDGLELCRAVKADPELKHTPIILLTARATNQSAIDGLDSGADDYLPKPFNTNELLARIANLIRGREEQQKLVVQTEELEKRVDEQVDIILSQRKNYEATILSERDRAIAASQLKQNILDNVSHEFRTPLTAIMGFAEILAETTVEEDREFVDTIRENGERLLATLDGILRLANLRSNPEFVERRRTELGTLVEEVLEDVSREHGTTGHTVQFNAGTEPAMAEINTRAVSTAVENVLENAFKFSPNGGNITVTVENVARGVQISVSDEGIGIPPDRCEDAFEPFKQVSQGLAREYGGVGIGLSVARELVEDHAGTIRLHSQVGEGTTIRIWLPLERTDLTKEESPDRPAVQPPSHRRAPDAGTSIA